MIRGRTRLWGTLAVAALVAAACGGSEEPAPDTGEEAAEPAAAEGSCEPGRGDPVADARELMDEQALAGLEFEGSAEVCGLNLLEVEAVFTDDDVRFGNPSFAPTVLVGDPGQELTIRATNRDTVAHTFTLEEQDIDELLQAAAEPGGTGDSVEVEVTFPSDGQPLLFQCRFHRDQLGALTTY